MADGQGRSFKALLSIPYVLMRLRGARRRGSAGLTCVHFPRPSHLVHRPGRRSARLPILMRSRWACASSFRSASMATRTWPSLAAWPRYAPCRPARSVRRRLAFLLDLDRTAGLTHRVPCSLPSAPTLQCSSRATRVPSGMPYTAAPSTLQLARPATCWTARSCARWGRAMPLAKWPSSTTSRGTHNGAQASHTRGPGR